MDTPSPIAIETTLAVPRAKAWMVYTEPAHIMQWNHASPDWHCPAATNDLRVGGTFCSTMAAKDGSVAFDFEGTYTDVQHERLIAYVLADGRKAEISFSEDGNGTLVSIVFDPENENPVEMQRAGWQAILDTYKLHAETC